MVATCCVPGCRNRYSKESTLEFCRIPQGPDVKELWTRAIFKDQNTPRKNYDRICGAHFITGMKSTDPSHPDYIPSVFPSTTPEEFRELQQKYEVFRREQERSLLKLNSELSALNQLWQEKGWSQETIRKFLYDGYTPSVSTPNQVAVSPAGVIPVFEPEQYLILDKGMGMGKMVVRLSRPVKYVTSSGPLDSCNKTTTTDQNESSHGSHQRGRGDVLKKKAAKSLLVRAKMKKNKTVQVDGYIDIDADDELETMDISVVLIKDRTKVSFSEKLCDSVSSELDRLDPKGSKLTEDRTASASGGNERVVPQTDPDHGDPGDSCVLMDYVDYTGQTREKRIPCESETKSIEESVPLAKEAVSAEIIEGIDMSHTETNTFKEREPMECDSVADGIEKDYKDKENKSNNHVAAEAKTDEKLEGNEECVVSHPPENQTGNGGNKAETSSEDVACGSSEKDGPIDERIVQNNFGSQLSDNFCDSLVRRDGNSESMDTSHDGKDVSCDGSSKSDHSATLRSSDEERSVAGRSDFNETESLNENKESENEHAEDEHKTKHNILALDHSYHQDEENKKIEIKVSKEYIPSQASYLRCQDICVERSPGWFKICEEVVIGDKKLTRQKEGTDAAVQTDASEVYKLQLNLETERLTLMEEMLGYHNRVNNRSYAMHTFENNPEKVQLYTGCANFETLKELYDFLIAHIPTPTDHRRSYFEQFVITLMKLRLGLKMQDLGYQLSLSNARLSGMVTHWFDGMYCCLANLVDWPKAKKLTLKFYLDKIQILKRRYFILENVYDNLKTSDNWMLVKGVKDTVRVCDALSKFYVPGPDDDPQTTVDDVTDPFEVAEPVTEDEETSSSSESSYEETEEETEDEVEVPTNPPKSVVAEPEESYSEDNQEIQHMLDANISVKDMNNDASLMSGSLMDPGLVDMSLASNAFSNYPGIDCGLSGSYSSMDTALIRQLGLDTVSTSNMSGDSVFSSQPALSNMESLFGMTLCNDSTADSMDQGGNNYESQGECSGSQVNVNTLNETISLLANRLKSDKKETKRVGRRSSSKNSPRKTLAESPQKMTSVTRALGDHSYIRIDAHSPGFTDMKDDLVESAFHLFPESLKNDHSYCFSGNQGFMGGAGTVDDVGMDDTDEFDYRP